MKRKKGLKNLKTLTTKWWTVSGSILKKIGLKIEFQRAVNTKWYLSCAMNVRFLSASFKFLKNDTNYFLFNFDDISKDIADLSNLILPAIVSKTQVLLL